MAGMTRQQQMDALLAGTFDKLDTKPKMQPGYSLDQIYGGILPTSAPGTFASTFPARPGVPFANVSRDRLMPNANPDIPGAGVAANDWYSQPGSYVNRMGAVETTDLPALKKPPIDITVRGGNTTNSLLAMMGGSRGGIPALPQIPQDESWPQAAVRYDTAIGPGLPQMGDPQAAVASLLDTTNSGIAVPNGYTYDKGKRTGRADWAQGLTTAQQYAMANQRGGIAAAIAPRTGNAGGYSYVNGQKTGYAQPASVLGMTFETPTNGAQAYAMANALAKAEAQAKATRLGNARMATGSDVGSGIASSTNPWGI